MNKIDIPYRLFDLKYCSHAVIIVGKNYALNMPFDMMQETTFLRNYLHV